MRDAIDGRFKTPSLGYPAHKNNYCDDGKLLQEFHVESTFFYPLALVVRDRVGFEEEISR
jgi:hypothetical protein